MSELATLPALRAVSTPDAYGAARVAPHNIEAEQALLGALLVNNVTFEKVGELLRPEHFYDPVHGRIYNAIATLINRGQIADPKTLRGAFERDPALEAVGGANYLVDLAANIVTIFNVADYAQLIHDLYLRRELIELGTDMVNEAFQQDIDKSATQQIENTESKLFELASAGESDRSFVKLEQALTVSIKLAEEAYKRDSHITGVTSGFRDLDRKMGGLQRSDLLILAGRPSMGKTALATNIAFNAAHAYYKTEGREGGGVAFFSLEMSSEQLATRLLGDFSSVPSDKIRRGEIKNEDFSKFLEASQALSRVPLYIDDTPGLSVAALRTRARRLKRMNPNIGLIVIDYLQLLRGGGSRREENRVQEVSEISRGLKTLAKELNIPVLALSQLSRAVESREDNRPQLSDLRESGSIEQDADVVMFIFREEYYLMRNGEPKPDDKNFDKWQRDMTNAHNIAEVIVAKQRHGPIGTVKMHFDGQFTRFSDLEQRFEGGE